MKSDFAGQPFDSYEELHVLHHTHGLTLLQKLSVIPYTYISRSKFQRKGTGSVLRIRVLVLTYVFRLSVVDNSLTLHSCGTSRRSWSTQ
jgi:hypothetical protein